jgi:hypothetical protein
MLEIVEQEQRVAVAQVGELVHTDRRGDRRLDEVRLLHAGERNEKDAAHEFVDQLRRGLQC